METAWDQEDANQQTWTSIALPSPDSNNEFQGAQALMDLWNGEPEFEQELNINSNPQQQMKMQRAVRQSIRRLTGNEFGFDNALSFNLNRADFVNFVQTL